jgi:hypothetical protein
MPNFFILISRTFLVSRALLSTEANSAIGPIRTISKFLMIPGEIDPSALMDGSARTQCQACSLQFDRAGKVMNESKVKSVVC